jgi:intermediate peptidase
MQPQEEGLESSSTAGRVIDDDGTPRGLFSIPQLRQPGDFLKVAQQAMEECDRRREDLSLLAAADGAWSSSSSHILYQLDAISQAVCNVIDAAELARSVHADEQWRESAHNAFGVLSEYIAALNSDPVLYRSLVSVVDDPSSFSALSEEERRFATLLRAEFEREGIHLRDATVRDELREVQAVTIDLEGAFSRNLVSSPVRTFCASAEAVRQVLPLPVIHYYVPSWSSAQQSSPEIELPSDQALLQSLIRYSPDPTLRRQAYLESVTAVPENLPVLDGLVRSRDRLARILGFESYAHYALSDKMARNPHRVSAFLAAVTERNRPAYRSDMERVLDAKRKVEGTAAGGGLVEPWDIPYYVGLLKARDGFDPHAVSEYLPLDSCVRGMQALVRLLFGIHMAEVRMTEDERWDKTEASIKSGRSSAEDPHRVRRFDFTDEDGASLGTMYLDLHPRPGKYGHAAHFTVRCGCLARTSPLSSTNNDDDARIITTEKDAYQKPIVALVCNLSSGRDGNNLGHGELETLFHEFGHALHSLLSRTKFQHMSGTRAAMDFVETPSHLMENFAWDPEFLRIVAVHHRTGETIPGAIVQRLLASRYAFSGIERQNQIIYALFDQRLFGRQAGERVSSVELFDELHRANGMPHAAGTHWHSRFGHLVTYGAGYYGYLFSQVFAGDIWKECFQGRSLSRESGDRLWHRMLMHGGAKDPWLMLEDMLGRPPMAVD